MAGTKRPFKKGMIILWSGLITDIPGGWHLCDGTTGTPNLRNNFVVGAGDSYVVGAAGGSVNHVHSGSTNGHTHNIVAGGNIGSGPTYANSTDTKTDNFTTDSESNLPPYYALAYIMKL